ncbi:MAG: CHASE2 domain-containing protein [Halobacteriovoraceae bacterium]|nr:CHASE2 domain-containing protein [Halobacteriovoraceae bacterium]
MAQRASKSDNQSLNMPNNKNEINSFYPLFFTAAFILILIQYPFSNFDAIFYDLWVKFTPKSQPTQEYVVISLDEMNDQILGEYYPYTYATHSKILKKILPEKPLLVNYFVHLEEPLESDDEKFYDEFVKLIEDYQNEDSGYFRFGTSIDLWGEQVPPDRVKVFGYSPALINVDGESFAKDSVHRKALINISSEDTLHLWSANVIRQAEGEDPLDATSIWGAYYDSEADATFAYYRHMINFFDEDDSHVYKIPFYRILNGDTPPGFFKNKVVLIGPQYESNSDDFVLTSFGKENRIPKTLVHASLINSLSLEKTIYPISDLVSDILSLLIAIILSFVISKVQPTRGLLITIFLICSLLIFSYLSFAFLGIWLKIAHIILSIFIVYYIWVPFRAIAEYQSRYAIEEETKILKQVENLKQNFISLMSHDLKTPVAKIAGMADILRLKIGEDHPEKKIVNDIILSTKELNSFITSILDLTKVESQNLQLNIQSKDINVIIEGIVEKLQFEANSKDIKVSADLSPLYPIEIDVTLMNRVISNIVENAIKYSNRSSEVRIRTYDDEKWVYIEVKDTGPGIEEKDLAHIFDKFYRVKNDQSHKIKGSGLGLYLVKYFIELHKGEIDVSSVVGEGTTFTIKLINK